MYREFTIELTEQLWDTLNPNPPHATGEQNGSCWMLSKDQYFVMMYYGDFKKGFVYHDTRLNNYHPVICANGHTLVITNSMIYIKKDGISKVIWGENVVDFTLRKTLKGD